MKTLLLITASAMLGSGCYGQGLVWFGNRVTVAGIDAPVYDIDGITRLAGSAYKAQFYWGTDADSLAPVGPVLDFREGGAAGYIVSTIVAVPGAYGGTTGFGEMRAWAVSQGSSWEAAYATGRGYGKSNTIRIAPVVATPPPANMVGLESFALVPEPSSVALVGLGFVTLSVGRILFNSLRGQPFAPGNRRPGSTSGVTGDMNTPVSDEQAPPPTAPALNRSPMSMDFALVLFLGCLALLPVQAFDRETYVFRQRAISHEQPLTFSLDHPKGWKIPPFQLPPGGECRVSAAGSPLVCFVS